MLFDSRRLASHQRRATQHFDADLWDRVVERLQERLSTLKPSFQHVLELTPPQTPSLSHLYPSALNWTRMSLQDFRQHPPGSFTLIISALVAHWVNDLPKFFRQAQQLLAPQGVFLCTFWGGETLMELRQALIRAEQERVCARISPMVTLESGVALLKKASFTSIVADQETFTVFYATLSDLFIHLRKMGERGALIAQQPASRLLFQNAEKQYREYDGTSQGDLSATFQLITLTGWAPAMIPTTQNGC